MFVVHKSKARGDNLFEPKLSKVTSQQNTSKRGHTVLNNKIICQVKMMLKITFFYIRKIDWNVRISKFVKPKKGKPELKMNAFQNIIFLKKLLFLIHNMGWTWLSLADFFLIVKRWNCIKQQSINKKVLHSFFVDNHPTNFCGGELFRSLSEWPKNECFLCLTKISAMQKYAKQIVCISTMVLSELYKVYFDKIWPKCVKIWL